MKRRSNVATQRSATQADWVASPDWPPVIALTFREGRREGSGTTGSAETTRREFGGEPGPEGLQQGTHVIDGVAPEVAHAAVGHMAMRDDVEPVDASMPQAHTAGSERLGDDGVPGVVARNDPGFTQVRYPREAAALLVDRGTDVHGSLELDSGPS